MMSPSAAVATRLFGALPRKKSERMKRMTTSASPARIKCP